jgi:hypothetical protein
MNTVYIFVLAIIAYFSLGLVFMGMERRWKITAYLNGFLSFLDSVPKTDYQTARDNEISKWKEEFVIPMFFFWGFVLIYMMVLSAWSILEIIEKSVIRGARKMWNFFYNGFRMNPS